MALLYVVICGGRITCKGSTWGCLRFDLAAEEEKREAAKLERAWLTSEVDQAAPSSTTLAALTMPLDHQQLSYKDWWDVFLAQLDWTLQAVTAHYQCTLRYIVTISARTGDEEHAYNDLDLMAIDTLLLHNHTRLSWILATGSCDTNLQASWNAHEKKHKICGQGYLWNSELRADMASGIATAVILPLHSYELEFVSKILSIWQILITEHSSKTTDNPDLWILRHAHRRLRRDY
jgi:hypothetical protein